MAVYTDDFNRANGNLGSNWTDLFIANSAQISSNQLVGNYNNSWAAYYSAGTLGNDQYSKIQITTVPTGSQGFGVAVRCSGGVGTETYYAFGCSASSSSIEKFVSGTFTLLKGSIATTFSVGDYIEVRVSGTTISGYKNGVFVDSATDSSISSGKAGVWGYLVGGTGDSWEGGDLTTVTTVLYRRNRTISIPKFIRV